MSSENGSAIPGSASAARSKKLTRGRRWDLIPTIAIEELEQYRDDELNEFPLPDGFYLRYFPHDMKHMFTVYSPNVMLTRGVLDYLNEYNQQGPNKSKNKLFVCTLFDRQGECPNGYLCREVHCIIKSADSISAQVYNIPSNATGSPCLSSKICGDDAPGQQPDPAIQSKLLKHSLHSRWAPASAHPCLPRGIVFKLAQPNTSIPVDEYPSERIFETKGTLEYCRQCQRDEPSTVVMQHCAHFAKNGVCCFGPDCQFVHVVQYKGLLSQPRREPADSSGSEVDTVPDGVAASPVGSHKQPRRDRRTNSSLLSAHTPLGSHKDLTPAASRAQAPAQTESIVSNAPSCASFPGLQKVSDWRDGTPYYTSPPQQTPSQTSSLNQHQSPTQQSQPHSAQVKQQQQAQLHQQLQAQFSQSQHTFLQQPFAPPGHQSMMQFGLGSSGNYPVGSNGCDTSLLAAQAQQEAMRQRLAHGQPVSAGPQVQQQQAQYVSRISFPGGTNAMVSQSAQQPVYIVVPQTSPAAENGAHPPGNARVVPMGSSIIPPNMAPPTNVLQAIDVSAFLALLKQQEHQQQQQQQGAVPGARRNGGNALFGSGMSDSNGDSDCTPPFTGGSIGCSQTATIVYPPLPPATSGTPSTGFNVFSFPELINAAAAGIPSYFPSTNGS